MCYISAGKLNASFNMGNSELSFLKQGRPRTYLLRLSVRPSVRPSCRKPKKPKHFGEKFDDDAEGGPLRGDPSPKN